MEVPGSVPLPAPTTGVTLGAYTGKQGAGKRINQSCPGGGGGYGARHGSQQQSEPTSSPDSHRGSQLPCHHLQPPGVADRLDGLNFDGIEAVGIGDETSDFVAGCDQQSGPVGRFEHGVAERAER